MQSIAPVFIVSTGRAGSNMFARALARHAKLFAVHEPVPHLNAEAYARWRGTHSREHILLRLKAKRSNLIEQAGWNGLLYVESSHYCSHLIRELHELYGARFIYLYRDGRDFVRSGLERDRWYGDAPLGRKQVREWAKRWLRHRYLLDIGFSCDDHKLKPPRSLRSRMEKITWLWVEVNRTILESFEDLPATVTMAVRLEDFGRDVLRDILAFLGVEAALAVVDDMLIVGEKKPNRTKNRSIPVFEKWSQQETEQFFDLAGPMLSRLGYEPQCDKKYAAEPS